MLAHFTAPGPPARLTEKGVAVQATQDRSPVPCGDHFHVPVKAKDRFVDVLLDPEDVARLGGRRLSLGSHGYVQVFDDGRVHLLHRWMFGVTGRGYAVLVDHRSRYPLDCRRSNLRLVDGSVSNANRAPAYAEGVGAYPTRSGRWQAKVKWRRERVYLGTFATREEALAVVRAWREEVAPESIPPPAFRQPSMTCYARGTMNTGGN